jgi:hypothetical protein
MALFLLDRHSCLATSLEKQFNVFLSFHSHTVSYLQLSYASFFSKQESPPRKVNRGRVILAFMSPASIDSTCFLALLPKHSYSSYGSQQLLSFFVIFGIRRVSFYINLAVSLYATFTIYYLFGSLITCVLSVGIRLQEQTR